MAGYFGGGGAATSVVVGTTTLTGGTDTRVLFDDGGVIGEDTGFTYAKASDTLTVVGPVQGASFQLADSNASHRLVLLTTSNLTADRNLTLVPGDAARTITISGDTTISQDYSTGGSPQFTGLTLTGAFTGTTITLQSGVTAMKLNVFQSGNSYAGFGIAAGDARQYFPTSAKQSWGSMSEDGANTYTQRLALNANGSINLDRTVTAGGTTGAQTINKMAGTVNFAGGASSLVVTNSLVDASSIVFCVVRTNDATATIKNVVPAAGSFTITLTAAATGETSVGFWVTN